MLVLSALGVAVPPSGPSSVASVATTREQGVYALLGTGTLIRTTTTGRDPVTVAQLSRLGVRINGGGPFLARAEHTLFAAFPGAPESLFRVDLSTGRKQRVQLWRGLRVRALLIGARTRRVYVIGDGAAAGGSNLVVKVLSPDGTKVLADSIVKHPAGTVWGAALSPDEQHLAVAYHGDAEGFDLVDPATLKLTCRSVAVGGCLEGHGSVQFAGSRLFTSTGSRYFEEVRSPGTTMRRASGLTAHILEFAPEPRGRFLYLSGTCGYTAGIARLDLRTGKLAVLARGEPGALCGARLLVAGDRLLLAANLAPYPEPNVTSYLRIVDRRSGNLQRSVPTPGSIVDIATGP